MSSATAIQPLTPEWHEARRKGIGASEIAAVLGISPWESPFSLYWRKVEGWQVEETDAMRWGTALEPAIAAEYERRLDPCLFAEVRTCGLVVGPEPWMIATPDRIVVRPHLPQPDFGWLLEVKTASTDHGWGEQGSDEIPVQYRCQVLWQMLCTGYSSADVAVLIGASDYRQYRVLRDEKDIAVMVEAGRRFMDRIERQDPPPLDDHHATVTALKLLHPSLVDEVVDVPEDVARGYERAVYMERLAKRTKDRYEAQLRAAMGDHRTAYRPDGRKVATRVISEVAESTRTIAAHTRDYLLPPRERKPA